MKVRLFQPSLGREEAEAVREVFERAWLGLGPLVEQFEREWEAYIGCRAAVGLNSATAALHLALALSRFPEGKKVLVPALTFASTAFAPVYNRLEPVFVDCHPETLAIDIDDLQAKYSSDCVAVIPVHFGGHPAPMESITAFASDKGLKVVEDCAHVAGSSYRGRKLGTWGDFGCFSFEEKKAMTTGDGGMLCTDDVDMIDAARSMRWLGIDKDTWKRESAASPPVADARHWHYEIASLGFKYNMNDLAASIGIQQLKKLDAMNAHRGRCIDRYLAGIDGLTRIAPLLPYDTSVNSYWLFGLRCPDRDRLVVYLRERTIATGVHYMPIPLHPFFRRWDRGCDTATSLWPSFVTLPLHARLRDEEIDYVLEALVDFHREAYGGG